MDAAANFVSGMLAYGIGFGVPAFIVVGGIMHVFNLKRNWKAQGKVFGVTFFLATIVNEVIPTAPGNSVASMLIILLPVGVACSSEQCFLASLE